MSDAAAFGSLTSVKLAGLIRRAQRRAILCAPAVWRETAEACQDVASRLGNGAVRVVINCDEEVFRLGYGHIESVQALKDSGVDVRECVGLRAGLLVVDERAWAFTPTALWVQPEAHSDETPNAFELSGDTADRLARSLCPEKEAAPGLPQEPEIGHAPLSTETVHKAAKNLKDAPPIAFDVARQVRVFQPYIQYVEISLRGCAIQRHRVAIPKAIQGLGKKNELDNRLRTTFELIEKTSVVSSKSLDDEMKTLRENFTRSLGKKWGRIILRSARCVFDERVRELRENLDEHRDKVESELEATLSASRKQVVEHYLPLVKANPPDCLVGQLFHQQPNDDQIRAWLDRELTALFPKPKQLVSTMKLDAQFKDVTIGTLEDEGFALALKKAYPYVNWDKPFEEFQAAKEKPCEQPKRGANA